MLPNMEMKWALLLLGSFLLCSDSRECSIGFKIKNRTCVDEDECETPSLCGDNAQCINTNGSYYCICDKGFESKTPNFTADKGQCLDINECFNKKVECSGEKECVNTSGSYNCTCPKGYHDSECGDEDECLSSVCGVHSKCINTPGSFFCTCYPGFDKLENGTCADNNECEDPEVCGTNAKCFNLPGRYRCTCHQSYSNYGNDQSKCIKMNCDEFKIESDMEEMPKQWKDLLTRLRNSCESLSGPNGGSQAGEQLLENLFTSTDELLSGGNITSGKMLSQFLDTVENSMRLIGPQLKEPVTRMETHNTFAEVVVTRSQTPPTGSVTLSTDSALFNTSWETVVGKSYPGFAFVALVSYKDLDTSGHQFHKISRTSQEQESREGEITYQLNSKVVTAVVSNPETKQLSEPVMLIFTHTEVKIPTSTTTGKTIAAFPPQELSPGTKGTLGWYSVCFECRD